VIPALTVEISEFYGSLALKSRLMIPAKVLENDREPSLLSRRARNVT